MTTSERLEKTSLRVLSGVEIEKSAILWTRIDALSNTCPFFSDFVLVSSNKKIKPTIFTNDVLYTVGIGVPVYRREILFFSKSKINTGILIEYRQTKSKTSVEISFILDIQNKEGQNQLVENSSKNVFPHWWPQNLRDCKVIDLTNFRDLLTIKEHTSDYIKLIDNPSNSVNKIEIPLDADFAYMWNRHKSTFQKHLLELANYA